MQKIPPHYPEVLKDARDDDIPALLEREADAERNKKGHFTRSLASTLRLIAVLSFLVESDVDQFRACMRAATERRVRLIDQFEAGEPIIPDCVSMMRYQQLLDAAASGHFDVARALADRLGGRPKIESLDLRAFEIAMGYTMKAVVIGDDAMALERLPALEKACHHKSYANFSGYALALRGIASGDTALVKTAFSELLAGHRRLSKGRGLFSDTVDKYLSVWGLGMLNLARSRGVDVSVDDPLIPPALVIELR